MQIKLVVVVVVVVVTTGSGVDEVSISEDNLHCHVQVHSIKPSVATSQLSLLDPVAVSARYA